MIPAEPSKPLHCPICRKLVAAAAEDFPFCSERCRTIDLGKWASGGYVVPSHDSDLEGADLPALLPGGTDHDEE